MIFAGRRGHDHLYVSVFHGTARSSVHKNHKLDGGLTRNWKLEGIIWLETEQTEEAHRAIMAAGLLLH